jgi:hypothetical protein
MLRNPLYYIGICLVPLLLIGCSRNKAKFHPYGIQHAIVHLQYFGEIRGTDDIIFDNYGDREAHITHSELITDKEFRPTIKYVVAAKGSIITVDSVKFESQLMKDNISDSLFHLSPGDAPTPQEQFASFFGKQGFVMRGDTLIRAQGASLNAHVWQHALTPSYLYEFNGLIVGNYANLNGHINELRLISIDTVTAIDTTRFTPPNSFPIRDMTKRPSNLPNVQQ